MSDEKELQRELTRVALDALDGHAFALAGSGAIREHGIVDRATQVIDLFTNDMEAAAFDSAVDELTDELRRAGHSVDEVRRAPQFAQLRVTTAEGRWTWTSLWIGVNGNQSRSPLVRCSASKMR